MEGKPLVSVVIPAWNEEALLGYCLQSVLAQTCDFPFEVIVVDNGSVDGTAQIAREYGARVIYEGRLGVVRARVAGFAAARGDIIASTDADTVVPPDWLERLVRMLRDNPDVLAVGGVWEYVDGPVAARALVRLVNRALPVVMKVAPWTWSLAGFNFAVRKSAYHHCGGFRLGLNYGEDVDLGHRLRRFGRIAVDHGLMVKTSGLAFVQDPLCVRMILTWASLAVFSRTFLPPPMRKMPGSL